MSERLVQFFDAGEPAEHDLLGGKCASLVTMTAAGMPVPPGFAVTTAAYDAFVHESGIADRIHELLAGLDPDDVVRVDEVSAQIRELLLDCPVPEEVRAAIHGAYDDLVTRIGVDVPVAVRSSATAEDLPDASFAGQQDTYLWLRGWDDVRDHIRRCWASIYTSRAILYRLRNDIPDEGLSMAVAVQKMVNARVAGVAITLNPTTGDRSKIAIDASYGVGEMVVSGQVTPDNLLLDKVMLSVVAEHCGDKHAELVPDAATGELVEREVEPDRRERLCLEHDEFVAVAQLAKRAEKHYGCPQDIEWAFDSDLPAGENLLLLQARPETVHSVAATTAAAPTNTTPASGGMTGFMSGLTSSLTPRNNR
ncbi:PEP/pyruvate-binding domain-containing protein [Nocardioides sp. SLBN-35]|jgi:pyruvate,water dikinase|uniref:PEP/pyruvate-binding domain-containing protein n=1 Tax=Nocardioides sp. SLBN-35 TaxID=2768445 RepID=UPI001154D99A|nr:PEP/pyruvate-binding domain-containing protein [Nocardioides sp. SLBN-35]TQK70370.1 pyruvate,water dikinase [Nocardioides sp. SLBN-35]